MDLELLEGNLTAAERKALDPLLRLEAAVIDEARSRLEIGDEEITLELFAKDDRACPFLVILHREGPKEPRLRGTLVVGAGGNGGDYWSYDPLADDPGAFADDLQGLLELPVERVQRLRRGEVVAEQYRVGGLENPIGWSRFRLFGRSREVVSAHTYAPWKCPSFAVPHES